MTVTRNRRRSSELYQCFLDRGGSIIVSPEVLESAGSLASDGIGSSAPSSDATKQVFSVFSPPRAWASTAFGSASPQGQEDSQPPPTPNFDSEVFAPSTPSFGAFEEGALSEGEEDEEAEEAAVEELTRGSKVLLGRGCEEDGPPPLIEADWRTRDGQVSPQRPQPALGRTEATRSPRQVVARHGGSAASNAVPQGDGSEAATGPERSVSISMLSGRDFGTFTAATLPELHEKLQAASGVHWRQQQLVHGSSLIKTTAALQGLEDGTRLVLVVRRGIALIATASVDHTAKLWDAETGACQRTLRGHSDWVRSASFSADGLHLLTASEDCTARVWCVKSGACVQTLRSHRMPVQSAAFSPSCELVLTASDDSIARLWRVEDGELVGELVGHKRWILSIVFAPDGRRCLTGSKDCTARLWELSSKSCVKTMMHRHRVSAAVFTTDGTRIGTASRRAALLWDLQEPGTGATTLQYSDASRSFLGHTDDVLCAHFSPDGRRLATGSMDTTVRLWDTKDGKCVQTLRGHDHWIFSVTFAPDGLTLVSGSRDTTARVWDAATGDSLRVLEGHQNGVSCVVCSG